ncbi:GNAT family N-acetyltransferase [Alicyclobacillus sp. SO9]|uniref:GNAT family N-acetyltransferase n=1 Tax=Alicyclobacillus sp. SO9 TaxID=2665646 RepID=UPI0018E842FF|nr:GNAT family protein [Alicyclobacillus sp. SO9]QQE78342.1 GNAT family N-acetyltransferase [Alicyclobacillus sp. SO9]
MNFESIFNEFPIIESETLVFRKIELTDLDDIFEIYSNERVFEFSGITAKQDKSMVERLILKFDDEFKHKTKLKWGVCTKGTNERLVGIVEAFDFNREIEQATIGYFFAESNWNKGFATGAVNLLISFLFHQMQVNRIQAEVAPENYASQKVLVKNGFLKEGTLRQAAVWSGKGKVDLEIYSILKLDYLKRNSFITVQREH